MARSHPRLMRIAAVEAEQVGLAHHVNGRIDTQVGAMRVCVRVLHARILLRTVTKTVTNLSERRVPIRVDC